jgi:putative transposase
MLRITLPGKGRRLALLGWHQRHGRGGGEIVGWAMEDHMRAKLCCDALEMALGRRGPVPGLIHHSDRGSQYAGADYRKLIKKAGLTQTMRRKGECLDNVPMESFFASLKKNYPS